LVAVSIYYHNGISKDEADFMLRNDVKETISCLERYEWFNGLNNARRIAMIDMTFIKEKSKNQTELIDNLRYALKNWKE
jgi:hypothetical protein